MSATLLPRQRRQKFLVRLDGVKGVGKPQEEGGDVDNNKYSPQLWNQGLIDQQEAKNDTKVWDGDLHNTAKLLCPN